MLGPGYVAQAIAVVPDTPLVRIAVQTANVIRALAIGGNPELAIDTRSAPPRVGSEARRPVWKSG